MRRRTIVSAVVVFMAIVGICTLWESLGSRGGLKRAWRRSQEQPAVVAEDTRPAQPSKDGGAGTTAASCEMQRGGLRVAIVDERDHPQGGARVKVLVSAYPTLVWTDPETTDGTGVAQFPGVTAGRVVVYASVGSLSRSIATDVSAGAVTDVRVVVPRGVQVEGQVRHVERGPIEGLVLYFQRREGAFVDEMQATTDSAGLYRLTNAFTGRYLVWTRPGTSHAYLDVPTADSVGNDLVFGVLCVAGTVRDEATEVPIAGVSLEVTDPFFVTAVTDSRGTYQFFDLPRRSYRIAVKKDGYAIGLVDCKIDDPLPMTVDVSLQLAASLRLRVTDTTGHAVTGEHVYRAQPLGSGVEAGGNVVTDGSGWLTMAMAPGVYDLSLRADGYKPANQHIVISPGENTASVNLELKEGAEQNVALRGTVRDRTTGGPVPGVRLVVDGVSTIAVSDEQGEYRFRSQWTGRFSLFVLKDGYGASILRDVAVEKGACHVLDIALEPAAVLQMHVIDRNGRPIEGRIGTGIRSLDPDRQFGLGTTLGPAKEGRLTYSQLLPGRYRLTFSCPGGQATLETTVPAGTSDLEVRLR
jgi:hypothetical protein